MNRKECYQVLELSEDASMEDVRKAYLKLSKKYHPDINPSGKQRFQQVNEAYNRIRSNEFGFSDRPRNHAHRYDFRDFSGFKDMFKHIAVMLKNGKAKDNIGFIGILLLRVVLTAISLFLFFRPLFSMALFFIVKLYEILIEIFLIILYLSTLIVMNVIDLMISFFNILRLIIKPLFLVVNVSLSFISEYLKELKLIIVVSIMIIAVFKFLENIKYKNKSDKILPFIFSIIMLIILLICEVYI